MFDELEEKSPDHFAVRQYKKFKLSETGRDFPAADGRHELFQLWDLPDVGALVNQTAHMDRQTVRPFLSQKYDITKHPLYKYLSDYDKKNAFDIERFLSTRLKPKSDEGPIRECRTDRTAGGPGWCR